MYHSHTLLAAISWYEGWEVTAGGVCGRFAGDLGMLLGVDMCEFVYVCILAVVVFPQLLRACVYL